MKFSCHIHVPSALRPVRIVKEAGWVTGPIAHCTQCAKYSKSLIHAVKLCQDLSAINIVTISSELHVRMFTKCGHECEMNAS